MWFCFGLWDHFPSFPFRPFPLSPLLPSLLPVSPFKKSASSPSYKNMIPSVHIGRNVRVVPLSWRIRAQFSSRVNGIYVCYNASTRGYGTESIRTCVNLDVRDKGLKLGLTESVIYLPTFRQSTVSWQSTLRFRHGNRQFLVTTTLGGWARKPCLIDPFCYVLKIEIAS